MLTSADRGVLARDPEVRALEVLLDGDLLAARLSERLGRRCTVTPGRLRYKPGTSCVLAFGLTDTQGGTPVPCIAKAYAGGTSAKLSKSLEGVAAEHVLLEDRSQLLVVTTLAGDRHLHAGRLTDPAGRAALLERLVGSRRGLAEARVSTLRHNPERRWVATVDLPADDTARTLPGTGRLVLRSYRPAAAAEHITAYRRLGGTAVTPPFLGSSRRHGMLAVGWAEGSALTAAAPTSAFHAAGRAVALLHGMALPHLPAATPEQQAGRCLAAADQVAALSPDEGARARSLSAGVARRLRGLPAGESVLHGDLSHDQMVLDASGEVRLVDLDAARVGNAAEDLGTAWAALLLASPARSEGRVGARVEALLAGYQEVAPLPGSSALLAHRDAQLLRRAGEGFRTLQPGWDEHLSRALSLVEPPAAARPTPLPGAR